MSPQIAQEIVQGKKIFSSEDLALVDFEKIPEHVAIIMDGNRRWAKNVKLSLIRGHWEGAEVLIEIIRAAQALRIKTLTVYAFSTENWLRPENEIEALMKIFEFYLVHKRELMVKEGVCLNAIGDLTKLSSAVREAFEETKKVTQKCGKINLVLALNYGGRDEICRAFKRILQQNEVKKINPSELTEEFISQNLDTFPWGDPALLIRTSGEFRVSNFLLWQISYTEFYTAEVCWPDFTAKDLLEAVICYQHRQKRGGE